MYAYRELKKFNYTVVWCVNIQTVKNTQKHYLYREHQKEGGYDKREFGKIATNK